MTESWNLQYVVYFYLSYIHLVGHARFLHLEDSRIVTRDQHAKGDVSVRKEKENVKRERESLFAG